MAYWQLAAAFIAGAVAGAAGFLLYMQYRTRKQMQQMQEQMGDLMGGDIPMAEDMEGMDDLDAPDEL